MKNEIKVNKANKSITFINNGIAFSQFGVADEILDCITNLQEENTELKELADKYEEEHSTTFNYWKQLIKEDYKSRCEKAIEYIENNKKETSSHFNGKEYVYRNFTLCCEPNDLLNILKGSGVNE